MKKKIITTQHAIVLQTTLKELWKILTTSKYTKQYMFNCIVHSEWGVGSSITWRGNYHSFEILQKGRIIAIEPYSLLTYSIFNLNVGANSTFTNYRQVSYVLKKIGYMTELSILNKFVGSDEKEIQYISKGWEIVIDELKKVVAEKKVGSM